MEGRERIAELIVGPQDSGLSQSLGLPLTDLDSVYEKWLHSHAHVVSPGHSLRDSQLI